MGPLVHWTIKVKILSGRTSGVPPVIFLPESMQNMMEMKILLTRIHWFSTLLVFLGHVKCTSKEPHNTFCPTDKCKHFPFSGTVSNSVVSFFFPGFSFLGGKKLRFWVATPFCSLLLSLWVGNAIKTLPFLPHNSRSFAYHCLSWGKNMALKIREEQ